MKIAAQNFSLWRTCQGHAHTSLWAVLLPLSILLATAFSCNSLMVSYIEYRVESEIDERFDLSDEQEEWVEKRVSYQLSSLRSSLIPALTSHFESSLLRYQDGLSKEDIDYFIDGLKVAIRPFVESVLTDMASLAQTMSDAQYDHFAEQQKQHRKEREDRRKKHLTTERVLEIYTKWYGELPKSAVDLLTHMFETNPDLFRYDIKIKPKLDIAASSTATFKDEVYKNDSVSRLKLVAANPDKVMDIIGYDDIFEQLKTRSYKLEKIDKSMTKKNREHFTEQSRETITKLSELKLEKLPSSEKDNKAGS